VHNLVFKVDLCVSVYVYVCAFIFVDRIGRICLVSQIFSLFVYFSVELSLFCMISKYFISPFSVCSGVVMGVLGMLLCVCVFVGVCVCVCVCVIGAS
jgi:hypothetical protein